MQRPNPSSPARPAAVLDWPAWHRRLAAARERLERTLQPPPDAVRAIFRERARRLAAAGGAAPAAEATIEVLVFMVAHERYALETSRIRGVQALREFAPVPGAPPSILGLVGVRGEMVTILSLKHLFEIPDQGLMEQDRVVLLEGPRRCALLANGIEGIRRIDRAAFRAPPATLDGLRAEFTRGVAADGLTLLEAEALLRSRRLGAPRGGAAARGETL